MSVQNAAIACLLAVAGPFPLLAGQFQAVRVDWSPPNPGPEPLPMIWSRKAQADEAAQLKRWAVATILEEMGFRMAELKVLREKLSAFDEGAEDNGDHARIKRVIQRQVMEAYWSINRLKRELLLIAPEEFSRSRPEPDAVVPEQLKPLLGVGTESLRNHSLPPRNRVGPTDFARIT